MLHVCAKLGANVFIRYVNISILRNSIWPPSAILDLLGKSWDHSRRPVHSGYPLWKFRYDQRSRVEVISLQFLSFICLIVLFMDPTFSVLRVLLQKIMGIVHTPKVPLARNDAFWDIFGRDLRHRVVALCTCRHLPLVKICANVGSPAPLPDAAGKHY